MPWHDRVNAQYITAHWSEGFTINNEVDFSEEVQTRGRGRSWEGGTFRPSFTSVTEDAENILRGAVGCSSYVWFGKCSDLLRLGVGGGPHIPNTL